MFTDAGIGGVWIVEPEPRTDSRGLFARTFCRREFEQRGLAGTFAQCSVSWNRRAGTIRGLHWQRPPHEETKLVRCTAGAVFDVAVDVRPGSLTFGSWVAFKLTAVNRTALYIPPGFAHGFQALTDGAELTYQIDVEYVPSQAAGVRWDDPDIAIDWPILPPTCLSDRDRALPTLACLLENDHART
jgi:dTDP-4-dehydrorhamnose 3,5-epimerase